MFLAVYNNLDDFKGLDGFIRGLYVSLIAICIVFTILVIICFCVSLLKNINRQKEDKEEIRENKEEVKNTNIEDEDMMVACLIATIDHKNETNLDARLVSVKRIN